MILIPTFQVLVGNFLYISKHIFFAKIWHAPTIIYFAEYMLFSSHDLLYFAGMCEFLASCILYIGKLCNINLGINKKCSPFLSGRICLLYTIAFWFSEEIILTKVFVINILVARPFPCLIRCKTNL